MATIECLNGKYRGQKVVLHTGRIDIGRGRENSIAIESDNTLSRQHASIVFQNGICYCVDRGSTNGSFVDGRVVRGAHQVVPSGGIISLGQQSFRVEYGPEATGPVVQPPPIAKQIPAQAQPEPQGKPVTQFPPAPPSLVPQSTHQTHPPTLVVNPSATSYAPTARQSAPPPTAKIAAPRVEPKGDWYGAGSAIEIAGLRLEAPMTYIGERLVAPRGNRDREEPSLIIPSLKLETANSVNPLPLDWYWDQLGYWNLSPHHRYQYIKWLAGGRRSEVPEPYLLLFLCGVERRLEYPDSGNEEDQLVAEVRTLTQHYDEFQTFRHYSLNLRARLWTKISADISFDFPPVVGSWEWEDTAFSWTLSCLLHYNQNFMACHACEWLSSHKTHLSQRVVGQRCWEEIKSLFALRVSQAMPAGWSLNQGKGKVVAPSSRLNASVVSKRLTPSLWEVVETKQLLAFLRQIADDCKDALDPMAKWIGPSPSESILARAELFLPAEIFAASKLGSKMDAVLLRVSRHGCIALSDLMNEMELGTLAMRRESVSFYRACASLGFVVEPDPRMGVISESKIDSVVVRQSPTGMAIDATPKLGAAMRTAIMAAALSNELESLGRVIQAEFDLEANEAIRIETFIEWLSSNRPQIKNKYAHEVPPAYRDTASSCLVRTVQANMTPSSIKGLIRFLADWEWSEKAVYQILNVSEEPIRVTHASTSQGFQVPQQYIQSEQNLPIVNMDLVSARLEQTMEAAKLLGDIFSDTESEVENAQPIRDNTNVLTTILSQLTSGTMELTQLSDIVSAHNLMLKAAIEALNDFSLDQVGEMLIEGDGPFIIDEHVLTELRNESGCD